MVTLKLKYVIAIPIVLLVLGISAYYWFRETEEDRVRNTFQILSDAVEKKGKEGFITAMGETKSITNTFQPTVSFQVPEVWTTGPQKREELIAVIYQGRQRFRTLALSFYDLEIQFDSESKATVSFSAMLEGTLDNGEKVREVRELLAALEKDPEKNVWRFSEFRIAPILKK